MRAMRGRPEPTSAVHLATFVTLRCRNHHHEPNNEMKPAHPALNLRTPGTCAEGRRPGILQPRATPWVSGPLEASPERAGQPPAQCPAPSGLNLRTSGPCAKGRWPEILKPRATPWVSRPCEASPERAGQHPAHCPALSGLVPLCRRTQGVALGYNIAGLRPCACIRLSRERYFETILSGLRLCANIRLWRGTVFEKLQASSDNNASK